jgi:hypothetical protein
MRFVLAAITVLGIVGCSGSSNADPTPTATPGSTRFTTAVAREYGARILEQIEARDITVNDCTSAGRAVRADGSTDAAVDSVIIIAACTEANAENWSNAENLLRDALRRD